MIRFSITLHQHCCSFNAIQHLRRTHGNHWSKAVVMVTNCWIKAIRTLHIGTNVRVIEYRFSQRFFVWHSLLVRCPTTHGSSTAMLGIDPANICFSICSAVYSLHVVLRGQTGASTGSQRRRGTKAVEIDNRCQKHAEQEHMEPLFEQIHSFRWYFVNTPEGWYT